MKRLLFFLLISFSSLAQSPIFFKYQAVVRTKDGVLISNKTIAVKVSILESTIAGTAKFVETHTTLTSTFGIINLDIGRGTKVLATLGEIAWGKKEHFIKIEMDPLGGSAFELVATTQLLSVPYALYAEKSGDEKWDKVDAGISYSGGNVGIGTINPINKLDVNGSINANQFLLNGSPLTNSPWSLNGSNISYNGGRVGIGTINPLVKLEINGGGDLNLLDLRNDNNSLGINTFVSSNTDFHGSALIGKRSRGTNSSPSVVAANDRITGLYGSLYADGAYQNSSAIQMYVGQSPGTGSYPSNIRFETTGTNQAIRSERMRIAENGNVGIGIVNPAYKLDVSGSINANQFLLNGSPLSNANPWTLNGSNISYNGGRVGIGTTNPLVKLEINGGGDLNLLDLRNDNNSLGINTFVSSNTDFHGSALIGRRSRGTNSAPTSVMANDRITGLYGSIYSDGAYQNSSAIQMYVGANTGAGSYPTNIRFETTDMNQTIRQERMRISESGNIGIGTADPKSKVQVESGDVYLSTIGTGVITKSPNGQCWRMTINNAGAMVITLITCP